MKKHMFLTNSIFMPQDKYIIDKPIRLISTFSGYDSQEFALKYLEAEVESWRTCEWAIKSIQALKDAHCKDDNTDYSQNLTTDEIFDYLYKKGISANYNEPMTKEQIKRLGEQKARQVYNNIVATKNMVNIQQVHGEDLGIVDVDKYCYIMTYSFPCQDLSLAGKGAGMEKDSGTRSGMLWQVERILDELAQKGKDNLPQVLLMENVPQVIGTNNIKDFSLWINKLSKLGYSSYYKVINAKDYGVPQNRERCFMVSVLGDYYYEFPKTIKLEYKLKDLLENNVDEKYYLSDKMLNFFVENSKNNEEKGNGFRFKPIDKESAEISKTITTRSVSRMDDNFITEPMVCELRYDEGIRTFEDNVMGTLRTNDACGGKHIIEPMTEPRICASRGRKPNNPSSRKSGEHLEQRIELGPEGLSNTLTTVQKDNYVLEPTLNLEQKLCNELIQSGRVQEYDVIRHSYSQQRIDGKMKDIQQNNIAPTLDTRCDCLGVVVKNEYLGTYEYTKSDNFMKGKERLNINNKIANTIQTTHSDGIAYTNMRIRKMTPKECFRLMGIKDKDFENIAQNQSNASLYHLAGDSIVCTVLMSIFGQLLGIDWKEKFNKGEWWKE